MANAVGYYNFKKILDLLRQLAEYHEQLQSWGYGGVEQLIYDTEMRLKQDNDGNLAPHYPSMWVIPEAARTDGRETTYEFNILIMDIANTKNFDNYTDTLSDTLDILKDVIAQLKYATGMECYCNLDIDYPIEMTPFEEYYDDYVNGWSGRIRLRVPDAINRCIAPYADFPPCDNNSDGVSE
jgi:hypothetical protein